MSAERRNLEVMRCVKCHDLKAWSDGFPNHIEAICWQCAWQEHVRDVHPLRAWKIRRRDKRIA
jgi:uncharacterized protein YdeI (YjbR/CyaY-like superfamily)